MSKIFRRSMYGVAVVATALSVMVAPAFAASKKTEDFITNATVGNQFEITSSRLALQNSQNDDVKTFAQQMIDDHTKAANDMKAAIASDGTMPAQPAPALDSSHQKMVDKLNKLQGADFDKKYVKMQVKAHDDTVSLFKSYAKNGDDAALKTFAGNTLPTLVEHQQHIKQISSAM